MTITTDTVTALAPDQASLKAASKLMKAAKWPVRLRDEVSNLVWGECQGSGANPYRVVFDASDQGYKCTCPSRKFPCKHTLALMWMYAETPADFGAGDVPDWVTDWLGRRRKTGAAPADKPSSKGKSLSLARAEKPEKPEDPAAIARREAAAKKRAEETEAALLTAVDDLEVWIEDQLRTGLGALLNDLPTRCRAIAARMVDGKAGALAGRIDEIPGRVLALTGEERLDALIAQLGKLVILTRAFRADPQQPDIRRAVATAEKREDVLADPNALRVKSTWEVVGERVTTRRDDLVIHAKWLLNLQAHGPRFALLLDFFPASLGRRSTAFANGEQFEAELVFYPARAPLRALVDQRKTCDPKAWPAPEAEPLAEAARFETALPWNEVAPVLLPPGRIALSGKRSWWTAAGGDLSLPLDQPPPDAVTGMALEAASALWDGARLSLLSAQTDWGRVALDG
ncbi:MAG: SWIM zinc finger family protein [Pseudomonadota bacterium]